MFTTRQKLFLGGAVLLSVLLVVGSYFGSRWLFGPDVEPTAEPSYATSVSHDTPSVSGTDWVSELEASLSDTDSATEIDEGLEAQLAALSDEDLTALAEALEQEDGVQNEVTPSETFNIMSLSPKHMLAHLKNTYTPQEQLDFLTSDTGTQWIREKLAPGFPIVDTSYLNECFELYPDIDSAEQAACLKARQQEIFSAHSQGLTEGFENIVAFLNQLGPQFHGTAIENADGDFLSIDESASPEPRIRRPATHSNE